MNKFFDWMGENCCLERRNLLDYYVIILCEWLIVGLNSFFVCVRFGWIVVGVVDCRDSFFIEM